MTLWILAECLHNQRLKEPQTRPHSPGRAALLNVTKLCITMAIYFWQQRTGNNTAYRLSRDEEQPLHDLPPERSASISFDHTPLNAPRPLRVWSARSTLFLVSLGVLYSLQDHLVNDFTLLHARLRFTHLFSYTVLNCCHCYKSLYSKSCKPCQYRVFYGRFTDFLFAAFLGRTVACCAITRKHEHVHL